MHWILSLCAGILFGVGLAISGMTDPVNITGFLDVTGEWNPQLIFVLAAAVATSVIGMRLVLKRATPMFATRFQLPTSDLLDWRLVGGAALFGIGWGLYGYCPGPAIAALAYWQLPSLVFVCAMLVGMFIFAQVDKLLASKG